ncbi:MAG: hypothetical protein Q8L40_01815, partial [Burkholderiales bacterium]|nr:hypothetical protein [Burkholderiales bacterium]
HADVGGAAAQTGSRGRALRLLTTLEPAAKSNSKAFATESTENTENTEEKQTTKYASYLIVIK